MEKTIQESSSGKWMADSAHLGMLVCASSAWSVPVRVRGRQRNGWEETQSGAHVEKIDETR